MSRPKKKFNQTTVGKILGGALGLINPALGNIVQGSGDVSDLIQQIKDANVPAEDKIRAQEIVLEAFEAEVADRASARAREIAALQTGSNDILFKTIGWTISLAFLGMVGGALGFWSHGLEGTNENIYNMAFGAVTAKMTAIVSYYFGSSIGSKQKTQILDK